MSYHTTKEGEDLGPDSPTPVSQMEEGLFRRRREATPSASTLGYHHRFHKERPRVPRLQNLSPYGKRTRDLG